MKSYRLQSICLTVFVIVFAFASFANAKGLRFAVISDTRIDALENALEFIASENAEFIIVPGDFYYDGQVKYFSTFSAYGYTVDTSNGVDEQGVYFALGNHDAPPLGDSIFVSQIAPYYPSNGPALSPEGTVFSFDRENCHFVFTNQYWDYPAAGYTAEQLDWIEQDLSASAQPFKFVVGHEPAFPFDRHIGNSLDENPDTRDAFWDILTHTDTTAYFCGHSHHLSHVVKNGVYQIDAGEVRGNHLCVTIVDITDETVSVRSYKTKGSVPVSEDASPENNDLEVKTVIDLNAPTESDNDIEYLYGAGPADMSGESSGSDEWLSSGCFINCIIHSKNQ